MSLPTASAAIGLAFIASTGMLGLTAASDPAPHDTAPRSVAVRVASVDPGFQALVPGMQVTVIPAALPVPQPRLAATNENEQLTPSGNNRRSSPTPLMTTPAAAPATTPAGPSGLQPVPGPAMKWPAPPPSSAAQPAPKPATTPKPMPASAPAQPQQRMTAPMPVQMPKDAGAMPAGIPRQVHGFDGIVASERALLQRTASTTRYEAHIASTRTAAEAETLWAELRAKLGERHAGAAMHLKLIDVPEHGRFVRLLAGDFNDAGSTADFCRAVIAIGKDCRILRKLESAG